MDFGKSATDGSLRSSSTSLFCDLLYLECKGEGWVTDNDLGFSRGSSFSTKFILFECRGAVKISSC